MTEITEAPRVVREPCTHCGVVANLDPWLHQERYGHVPTVRRDGRVLIHNGRGAFVEQDR